ncbi:hypothetical protein [Georhizobium profundi]|uniref:hypothetical protein n=1 Tax=Georhizobium profundi TaxID=2341112 RepID=UPI0013E08814|nr:hypothetical protein [Georhizobium profundi]
MANKGNVTWPDGYDAMIHLSKMKRVQIYEIAYDMYLVELSAAIRQILRPRSEARDYEATFARAGAGPDNFVVGRKSPKPEVQPGKEISILLIERFDLFQRSDENIDRFCLTHNSLLSDMLINAERGRKLP